ncbi:MAG: glycosyltransferase [Saprospiraceae bacterium]|nr:glycosyltransferase [Saprospiraceae bacterium]
MKIMIAATSDIHFDQRVQKIAGSLSSASYEVLVLGRNKRAQIEARYPFQLVLLNCFFKKSFFFYAEFNLRLFCKLLLTKSEIICACDLDTLLACTLAAKLKQSKLVFDAHEYFEKSVEIRNKKFITSIWEAIGKLCIPKADLCYTVSETLARLLSEKYHKIFQLIRNVPTSNPAIEAVSLPDKKILWYQGAVNEGRGLELLIECMLSLPEEYTLEISGDGDLLDNLKQQCINLNLQHRITFHGRLSYMEMFTCASQAWIGFDLLDSQSENYYYSLSNKTFDYIKAGLPVIQMNFPEYANIHSKHRVGVLLNALTKEALLMAIKQMESKDLQESCRQACIQASREYAWEKEEVNLLERYRAIIE